MPLLHVHYCRFLAGRNDHEDRGIDASYAVDIDGYRYVIDEYQAQDNLGEIADALGEVGLPRRIAVLFVSDSADDVKYCADQVGAGNVYDQNSPGLVYQQ